MNKLTKIWIKSMDWCSKYWGCHQIPERSFFFKGFQFPICARCTGILIGYITSPIFIFFGLFPNIYGSILFIVPMAIDGTVQLFTKYNSNNIKRVITGYLSGFGLVTLIWNIILIVQSIIK